MTTATAHEVSKRRAPHKATTYAGRLSMLCLAKADESKLQTWPAKRYQRDPVAFCREILGVEPWSKQIEILEAVRDHKRVAVCSGHKVGKSSAAVMLALWFYCSFERARVVMSSVTSRQVDQILWRELRIFHRHATRPIGGDLHELARSGLKAPDFREIVGFTAKEAEAVAGISGANLLYILDEASGIGEDIFEAIEGNRAAGARLVMLSNPTRTEGTFFEAFDTKAEFYKTIQVSSEDSPNVIAGRDVVPGLAGREWVEEKRLEWGEDSPLYQVRVKGQFVRNEDGKIITLALLEAAELRWHTTPAEGRLVIGLDPAGDSGEGDESVFAPRRGLKCFALHAKRGLTAEQHLAELLDILKEYRRPREGPALIVLDPLGEAGSKVARALREYAEEHPDQFELLMVRASDEPRQPWLYWRVRDELLANLREWLRAGGAIPEDVKLEKELHAPSFEIVVKYIRGARREVHKSTNKDELRKSLQRSPDRADALALSVWDTRSPASDTTEQASATKLAAAKSTRSDEPEEHAEATFDPYSALGAFGGS